MRLGSKETGMYLAELSPCGLDAPLALEVALAQLPLRGLPVNGPTPGTGDTPLDRSPLAERATVLRFIVAAADLSDGGEWVRWVPGGTQVGDRLYIAATLPLTNAERARICYGEARWLEMSDAKREALS